MAVYLVARLKVKYGHMAEASEQLGQLVELLKPRRWKLLHSFYPFTGDVSEITDIWEVPDANTVTEAIAGMGTDPEFSAVFMKWRDHVEYEHLSICGKMPFSP